MGCVNPFRLVETFNEEVIGIKREPVYRMSGPEREWFIGVLLEEIEEFQRSRVRVNDVDAILDLIYFAMGGLTRMGISANTNLKMFKEVHNANMKKKKGDKKRSNTSFDLDAVKEADWEGPEAKIKNILMELE